MINLIFDNNATWPAGSGNCLHIKNTTDCSIAKFFQSEQIEFTSGQHKADRTNWYVIEFNSYDPELNYFDIVPDEIKLNNFIKVILYFREFPLAQLVGFLDSPWFLENTNWMVVSPVHLNSVAYRHYACLDHWMLEAKISLTNTHAQKNINLSKKSKILKCTSSSDHIYGRLLAASIWYHGILNECHLVYGKGSENFYVFEPIRKWKRLWSETAGMVELFQMQMPFNNIKDTNNSEAFWQIAIEPEFDKTGFVLKDVWQAVIDMNPYVLASGVGSLSYMHSLGYKTFDEWIDESYDKVKSDEQRLYHVYNIAFELSNISRSDQEQIIKEMIPMLVNNYACLCSSKQPILENLVKRINS